MKIGIVLGTRPEIIKLSPIIRELEKLNNNCNDINNIDNNIDYFIIHTNQHYSENMDRIFFEELNLPSPNYNLNVGSGTHGKQTAKMLEGIEEILINERPDIVIVQGDTNTVLAGAIAASKLKIKIAHVEAGLRSYDRNMPEEINRVLTDYVSDYLFAPTEIARRNLLREGIPKNNIFVVGNTIVDATLQNIKIANNNKDIKDFVRKLSNGDDYFLITIHRAENTDNKDKLENIVESIIKIANYYDTSIIFPIHPRTENKLKEYGLYNNLKNNKNIKIIEPVGYLEFLMLEKNAKLILTDSGGVQEEACILKVPCITLRNNTERPETVNVGANMLVGNSKEKLINAIETMLKKDKNWENPFGNGKSGKTIVDILVNREL
jgi:UDP-N-acetylglucosamine 2-epimerase (non-hydrolysing)